MDSDGSAPVRRCTSVLRSRTLCEHRKSLKVSESQGARMKGLTLIPPMQTRDPYIPTFPTSRADLHREIMI